MLLPSDETLQAAMKLKCDNCKVQPPFALEKKNVKCRSLCNCKDAVRLAFFLQIQMDAGTTGQMATMNPSTKNQSWITVAMFENVNDGQMLETALKNKGFAARTYNDRLLQLFLFLCPPHATFRVQVRGTDSENLTDVLDQEPATSALLQKAIRCPSCGSLRVQYPQMTRKFFLPTLVLHLGIIFRVIEHEAYCESCHCLWNLPKNGSPARLKRAPRKQFPFNDA